MYFNRFIYLCLATGLAMCAATSPGAASGGVGWRLENPFRLFLDPEHTQMHFEAYNSLSMEQREYPVLNVERRLAEKFKKGWSAEVYDKTCWDEKRNSYRYCYEKGVDYIDPKKHRVLVNYDGVGERCSWTMKPRRKRAVLKTRRAPCDEEVAFDIPYPAGANVTLRVDGKKTIETSIRVKDKFIIGVGDSFASGEGNPDVPVEFNDNRHIDYGRDPDKQLLDGYPTRKGDWSSFNDVGFLREAARWQSRACHRSLYSWQLRAALQLALENPQRAVTYVGYACSGSDITTGLFLNYKGNEWDRNPPQLPQLSYISEELCGREKTKPKDYATGYTQLGKLPELQNMILNKCYKPKRRIDLVFLSIGGNDVSFSRLVANAILADKGALRKMGGWMGSIQDVKDSQNQLKLLKTRYKALNKAFHYMLRVPWKQSDRIILTAYPRMSYRENGLTYCSAGKAGMDLYKDFSVISYRLREGERFADELYREMKKAARSNGWSFVDGHRERFAPHGFCAIDPLRAAGTNEFLELPRYRDGEWSPYKPSEYRAYGRRQRWFRTPNDGYMSAHYHFLNSVSKRVLRHERLKWFQLIMAGTYSGSFHPTAEGHAAIADEVVQRARQVLKKYDK